jgi:hypothetical protein
MSEINKQSLPIFGLLTVRVSLALIDSHRGATAVANSVLLDGKRTIRVGLCQEHLLVSRALQRADNLTVRFLAGLALVEFCLFWGDTRDGASVRNELKRLAGFTAGDRAWGSSFASGLAISEPMRVVDTLPIFGRTPEPGPHGLFGVEVAQRSPSDIRNWATNGQAEVLQPLPPKAPKTIQPPTVVQAPDPFFETFHQRAKDLLSPEDFGVLEEMARGVADA